MRPLKTAIALIISLGLFIGPHVPTSQANVFDDLHKIVTDPLEFGHASDRFQQTVMDALAQLQPLMGVANDIVKQRLDQIKQIVDFAIQGGAAVEAKAYSDMLDLESKIMADVDQLLYRARCLAIIVLNGTLQQALAQAMANIAKSQPSATVFGIPFFRWRFKNVNIQDPDKAYFATKAQVLTNLNKPGVITDNTNAYEILSAYANLEILAEATRCNYLDKPNEITFVREQSSLEVEQLPWITVVALTP